MLNDIAAVSTSRLLEARSFLALIQRLSSVTGFALSTELAVAKGLFFVNLYGAYEYTVSASVQKTLEIIGSERHRPAEYKHVMLSVVLDPYCRSLSAAGPNTVWERRWELFRQLSSASPAQFDSSVLPIGSGNLKYEHLASIWTSLCVSNPILPRINIRGRLDDLVEKRNSIAHGRESPGDAGRRYTIGDLWIYHSDVNELCTHVVQVLEQYLINRDYLT